MTSQDLFYVHVPGPFSMTFPVCLIEWISNKICYTHLLNQLMKANNAEYVTQFIIILNDRSTSDSRQW